MADFDRESMLEMFSFEMNQLVDQLEQIIIESESGFSMDIINEVFRIMHTIKGSAAMMLFDSIATATHAAEDLFFYLREENPTNVNYSELTDYCLECMDFIKEELGKIEQGVALDGDPQAIADKINGFLSRLKGEGGGVSTSNAIAPTVVNEIPDTTSQPTSVAGGTYSERPFASRYYRAKMHFDEGAEMENVRAFTVVNNIKPHIVGIVTEPSDLTSEEAINIIRRDGFTMSFSTDSEYGQIYDLLDRSVYVRDIFLEEYTLESIQLEGLNYFEIFLRFDEGAQMENVRAYTVLNGLRPFADYLIHHPADLLDEGAAESVQKDGVHIDLVTSKDYDEIYDQLMQTIYLKELTVKDKLASGGSVTANSVAEEVPANMNNEAITQAPEVVTPAPTVSDSVVPAESGEVVAADAGAAKRSTGQAVISVNVSRLDQLLKLMGELVIVEAMVTQNPDLQGLTLENFNREVRQLRKIINDVQEAVMTMRLVSLSGTFFKMNRIVRDMCKALNKEAVLEIIGEDTEVDKNIIEHIGDPIMHIVRNSLDHGLESPEKRRAAGKPEKGRVILEARNAGSEVWIIIEDDGAGLNRDRILEKARNNGLLSRPDSEYTDKEIFQFIFLPGFSTNEVVTSYSGRGVGMDVVNKNLEFVGGSVVVDSVPGEGSVFTMKIPLSLAIIKGMIVDVAGAKYTVPIMAIRDSFRPSSDDLFMDPNGNEMITVRGEHFNVVRLHEFFGMTCEPKDITEGIMMLIENGDDAICLLVDDLVGEQGVVAKSIPKFIKKVRGISGCTLLGNGEISLILEVAGFFDK